MKRIPQLRRCLPLVVLAASLQLTPGYYDPGIQRWINRDPLGEPGFETALRRSTPGIRPFRFAKPGEILDSSNLHAFVGNCHRRLGVSSAWRLLGRAIGTPTHADAFPCGALTRRRCLSGSVQ